MPRLLQLEKCKIRSTELHPPGNVAWFHTLAVAILCANDTGNNYEE